MWLDEVYDFQEKYILCRYVYGIGGEVPPDAKYTSLHNYMLEHNLLPEYTGRSWSSDPVPVKLLKKYKKEDLISDYILTDKTESIPSIGTFDELSVELKDNFERGYISKKFDGWNYQFTYNSKGEFLVGATRGRAATAKPRFSEKIIPGVPRKIKPPEGWGDRHITIAGEATLSDGNFLKLKAMFPMLEAKSQRASVSTALANEEAMDLLSYHAFQIKGIDDADLTIKLLHEWGFTTPKFVPINKYSEIFGMIHAFGEDHVDGDEPTDGLVYWKAKGGYRRAIRLGKWEEKSYKSFVTGYIESPNTHYYSPSVKIWPIELSKSTQTQVNLTNWRRIINNHLKLGSPIAFILKSDSTADIDEVLTKQLQDEYQGNYPAYQNLIRLRNQH